MEAYLMHKNIVVAKMEILADSKISHLKRNEAASKHCPVGGQLNDMRFHEWWKDRAVPKTRKGSSSALKKLGMLSTDMLLLKNLGLSLTDCYWIKPVSSELTWEKVSLFRNDFIDIFGELTFDSKKQIDMRNKTYFKCATSQGELQKKWCIDYDDRRFLVKGNWGQSFQQSLNEVVASEVHKAQGIDFYTPYYLTQVDVEGGHKGIGCYSFNFCSEEVEFVSAWELLQLKKLKNNMSWFNELKDICLNVLGFSEQYFDIFMSYEIITDYLLTNTDRHMNNIGVLRNPDTLEYYGFAPIYDTGNSMFFRNNTVPSGNFSEIETHSFVKKEVNLLKLVEYRNIVDLSKLPNDVLLNNIYSNDIPERIGRIPDIIRAYHQKIYLLDKFQRGEDIWKRDSRRYC